MRMDADRCVDHAGMAAREVQRGLRRGEVPAGDADALDSGLGGAGDDPLAVGIEARVLEMSVRVDQAGQPLRRTATAQVAASTTSRRGKIGAGCAVFQSFGPAPQTSRAARPGPRAPRSSYGA